MSEIAKDECKKLQIRILSDTPGKIENDLFRLLEQIPLTSTKDVSIPISLLLTYINYSSVEDNFHIEFTKFFIRLLQSEQRSIREMTFVLVASLIKTETLEKIFNLIATQYESISHETFALILSFAYEFEDQAIQPWKIFIDPAKKLFGAPIYDKHFRKFVNYMDMKNREEQQKNIHQHHKVHACQLASDFVVENKDTTNQYIHMLRDNDWSIQLKAVEELTNIVNTKPDLIEDNSKTALLNLIDVINCPRTIVKSSGLKLAIQLIKTFPEEISIHASKYAEIAFDLCDNTLQFISKEANEILTLIATTIPRSLILREIESRCNDENPTVRANAARCFELMADLIDKEPIPFGDKELFVGGPLTDDELGVFIKCTSQLIRDKEELARTSSRKVMNILAKDPRFDQESHRVIPSEDYDMIMSDL